MSSALSRSPSVCWFACAASLPLLLLISPWAMAGTETTLYDFCTPHCAEGASSLGIAFDATSGNLFGVTMNGGKMDGGVVYEYAPGSGTYTVLYTFCKKRGCTDGKYPLAVQPVIDTSGNIYGTTASGGSGLNGGVVFELLPGESGWREKILHTFCSKKNCKDGSGPYAGLTYAGQASGQLYDGVSPLYGTTRFGGFGGGTGFSIAPKAGKKKWAERVLYSFCAQTGCPDGLGPQAQVTLDASGNLFGTTVAGGSFKEGTVFELSPDGGSYTESVLYSFCAQKKCADGVAPVGGLMLDTSGNLFGCAKEGGASDDGVLFELAPGGSQWQYSALVNFNGTNGALPVGTLIPDGTGGVYGTTEGFQYGTSATVFDFNGTLQTLYTFCTQKGCPDGNDVAPYLVLDGSGNLFGTTAHGAKGDRKASGGAGTLFEISP